MRVRELPIDPERSLSSEVLEWVAKLWMPFVALGVIAMTLGVYRLITDKAEPPPPITSEPAAVRIVASAPESLDDQGVPKESLWQPTKAQPVVEPAAHDRGEPQVHAGPGGEEDRAGLEGVVRVQRVGGVPGVEERVPARAEDRVVDDDGHRDDPDLIHNPHLVNQCHNP